MELLELVNALSNFAIFVSSTLFYIYVFTINDSILIRFSNVGKLLLRLGLAMPSAGSMYNLLIMQYPPPVEILINMGYASLFTWAFVFKEKIFLKFKEKTNG